jgi:hypothetical protein
LKKKARGGNDIKVTFLDMTTNLHRLCGSDLICHIRRTPEVHANRPLGNSKDRMMSATLDVDAVAWALASRAIGFNALVPANDVLGEDYAQELTLSSMTNCPLPAFASLKSSMTHSRDGVPAFSVGRVRWPRTGLSCTEPRGVSAIRLRSLARS